jgi:hypothetical protein
MMLSDQDKIYKNENLDSKNMDHLQSNDFKNQILAKNM